MIIDTHSHLYGKQFDEDRPEIIQRAIDSGVKKIYMPGIDSSAIGSILAAEATYPGICIAMMGLHPCSVQQNYEQELELVAHWLKERKFAAIGEIGLDFYWDKTYENEQIKAFHYQIELALQYQLPIVIHTRNAMQETINIVKQYANSGLRGIFHCFGGTEEDARAIIELGFLLGIGGIITYKNNALTQVLASISPAHIVLETDAPYLTPMPYRGKRNESSYLKYIIEKLAAIYELTNFKIAEITTANAEDIFPY